MENDSVTYVAPVTVDEVRALLASNPDARVFAGATDVLPQSKAGRPLPATLIDLKRIPRLTRISVEDGTWTIGAAASAVRVCADAALRSEYPGIVEAMALIGSDQIQSRATLGGNLCNASPAADTGPALRVNGARVVVASLSGERIIPVAELTEGPGRTSLGAGEFVVEFLLDRIGPRRSDAYLRFTPRTEMDIAVVGAGARVTLDESGRCSDAAVVLGAVAPTTVDVEGIAETLVGTTLDEDVLDRAAELSRMSCQPIDDKRGTKEFRVHIAGVLTKRALRTAAVRAGGKR
jgi:CO/xanthine dehydrogenase FAD-binding subunit